MSTAIAEPSDPNDREVSDLTFDQVVGEFAKASQSDVLILRDTTASTLRRQLEDAIEAGQYIYRVTNDGIWSAQVLTNIGIVQLSNDAQGRTSMAIGATPLSRGTHDFGKKIIEHQASFADAEDGRRIDTGAQFGRFYL